MTASIEFFPVGNGDMTLIRLATGKTILIDINIRKDADNEKKNDYPDVANMLKDRLERDPNNEDRLFVDVFILSHPDQDHCGGLSTHFHLGAPSTWKKAEEGEPEKILIREMWSSPLTFRRKDKVDGLVRCAEAWRDEAKRRVKLHKDVDPAANDDGNMLKIMGEDVHHGKTEGIEHILVKVGEVTNDICGETDASFSALLLSPKVVTEEEAEKLSGKNNSSIVMQFSLASDVDVDESFTAKFLTGGDAEVDIWKRVWHRNEITPENLAYHVLQTPHHCSWGSLSHDVYSDQGKTKGKGEECEINVEAYAALSQAEDRAYIISSCDEPEEKSGKGLAQRKYEALAEEKGGVAFCTMVDSTDKPLKILITKEGPTTPDKIKAAMPPPPKVDKGTTDKPYA